MGCGHIFYATTGFIQGKYRPRLIAFHNIHGHNSAFLTGMVAINRFKAELTKSVMPDWRSLSRHGLSRGHPELIYAFFLDSGSEAGMTSRFATTEFCFA
jgi:hypothetical protein